MSFIQSVLFNKKYYSLQNCYDWLIRNNLKIPTFIDETKKYYRFRQVNPNYKKYYYRTKEITPGIKFIIGFKK